jgi:hypothetical protein
MMPVGFVLTKAPLHEKKTSSKKNDSLSCNRFLQQLEAFATANSNGKKRFRTEQKPWGHVCACVCVCVCEASTNRDGKTRREDKKAEEERVVQKSETHQHSKKERWYSEVEEKRRKGETCLQLRV